MSDDTNKETSPAEDAPSEDQNPEIEAAAEANAEVEEVPENPEGVENVSQDDIEISSDVLADMFSGQFSNLEGFGPESEHDLNRTGGFRISVKGEQDFMTEINGKVVPAKMYLDDAILTALSHGENSSAATGRDYKIVQGQMRIKSRLELNIDNKLIPLNQVFFQIWLNFANPAKRDEWDFERFMSFMRNAGFPVDGNYIFNFELLGAYDDAIERYFKIFAESGARRVNRPNKPFYVTETLEFRDRGSGLQVTHIEIGKGDPSRGRNYGLKWTDEDNEEHTYPGAAFVDPVHAQLDNFQRFMSHFKQSVMFKRRAAEAEGDAAEYLNGRASKHRGMATQLLSNFGGVHRGMRKDESRDGWGNPEDVYYTNRVRCGRFGVQLGNGEIEEFNFWQPNNTEARAVTAGASAKTEDKGKGDDVLDMDGEEPW